MARSTAKSLMPRRRSVSWNSIFSGGAVVFADISLSLFSQPPVESNEIERTRLASDPSMFATAFYLESASHGWNPGS
jgi:hypothetical protein